MIINMVVAAADNNVIGKNNMLLWNLPNDMAFFKNTTWGMPVIMGRKTFESLGKPLKGRTNIVITTNSNFKAGNGDFKVVGLLALGFIVGSYFGSKWSISLDQKTVKQIFGVIIVLLGLKMVFWK